MPRPSAVEYGQMSRSRAWRERVSGYLAVELGQEIRARSTHRTISGEHADLTGDVDGLAGVHIVTGADKAMRISEHVDLAERGARDRGDGRVGVVVQRRHGRETDQAYVLLTLAGFAALVARLTPEGTATR